MMLATTEIERVFWIRILFGRINLKDYNIDIEICGHISLHVLMNILIFEREKRYGVLSFFFL